VTTSWATAACIASGPSLTREDCEAVRAAGLPTIVTNNTWELCPWANAIYAMDRAWWREYLDRVKHEFTGRRISAHRGITGVETIHVRHGQTSGQGAIDLAAKWGARRIILLGYDYMHTNGQRHWHGNHKKGLGNADKVPGRICNVDRLAKQLQNQGIQIINCSRKTAVRCFERMELEKALCIASASTLAADGPAQRVSAEV
jgi:predicted peroxiredoxin